MPKILLIACAGLVTLGIGENHIVRMAAADAWSWPEVQVHARALSLILANDCQGGEAVDQMLAGLRAVAEQAVHPG